MKVLIIYAHPNPMSFTKAILDNFVKGIKEAGHQYEILDLYKTKFNPIFQDMDFSYFVDKESPFIKKTLLETNIRSRWGVTVIAIIRNDQLITNPDHNFIIEPGDFLVLFGHRRLLIWIQAYK